MVKRIIGIGLIFVVVSIAWIILGASMEFRSQSMDGKLSGEVGSLWGTPQHQASPQVVIQNTVLKEVQEQVDGKNVAKTVPEVVEESWPLDGSDIKVALGLDYRQKGLMWYTTYNVAFDASYRIVNDSDQARDLFFDFRFPNAGATYDDFVLQVGERKVENIDVKDGRIRTPLHLAPGEKAVVNVAYKSRGMDEWWYTFGDQNVKQVKDFNLVMNTDFKDIDYPEQSISPSKPAVDTSQGKEISWQIENMLTGVQIGMDLPDKLDPGPWAAQVIFFAPISLLLFLFMVVVFTVMREVDIHPVNYFFICAAYFSFHLLLAYLVDHVSIHAAFAISAAVSILLVLSYMRLVVGSRFAFVEIGLSQLVFLVLFSYTFFFEGYTGLSITALCVLSLFIAMQLTAKVDWNKVFISDAKRLMQAQMEQKE